MNIPDNALNAAAADMYERSTLNRVRCRYLAHAAVRAAMPHLLPGLYRSGDRLMSGAVAPGDPDMVVLARDSDTAHVWDALATLCGGGEDRREHGVGRPNAVAEALRTVAADRHTGWAIGGWLVGVADRVEEGLDVPAAITAQNEAGRREYREDRPTVLIPGARWDWGRGVWVPSSEVPSGQDGEDDDDDDDDWCDNGCDSPWTIS